jgi:hypothetical protein
MEPNRALPAALTPAATAVVLGSLLFGLLACASNGARPATPSAAAVASTVAPPALPPPSSTASTFPPPTLGLPHDAALVASFDLVGMVLRVDDLRSAIEDKVLWISRGGLEAYLTGVGFNRNRPCSIAATRPEDTQRQSVEKLQALAASAPVPWAAAPGKTAAGLADALGPFVGMHVASWRILLPATDPTKLHAAIEDVLQKQHWMLRGGALVRPPSQLSDFSLPMVVTLTDDAANVAIDVDVGGRPRPEDSVESLRNAMREAHDIPPSLDGAALRVEWVPSALASLGALGTAVPGAAYLSSDVERDGFRRSNRDGRRPEAR